MIIVLSNNILNEYFQIDEKNNKLATPWVTIIDKQEKAVS